MKFYDFLVKKRGYMLRSAPACFVVGDNHITFKNSIKDCEPEIPGILRKKLCDCSITQF